MTTDSASATLPSASCERIENARNLSNTKERTDVMRLVVFDAKDNEGRSGIRDPITVYWWMGRSRSASVVYCSIWVRTRDGRHFSGRGKAGGGGYHKPSAAFGGAVRSAGITLDKDPAGVGEAAIRDAMTAIGKAAGYGRCPQEVIS